MKISAADIKPLPAQTHPGVYLWKLQEGIESRHACHRFVLCFAKGMLYLSGTNVMPDIDMFIACGVYYAYYCPR